MKESSKTVAELYRSFSRAASLVPTAETNICCEELCYKSLALGVDWRTKVKTLLKCEKIVPCLLLFY